MSGTVKGIEMQSLLLYLRGNSAGGAVFNRILRVWGLISFPRRAIRPHATQTISSRVLIGFIPACLQFSGQCAPGIVR